MSITELSIKRPLLIITIFVTLLLFGYISYNNLNYNLLPKMDVPVIMVQTTYRGASSEEVQTSITKPVEDAISSIEGVDKITSTSREGASIVVVQLKQTANALNAQRDAERKINQIKALLPEEADEPVTSRFSMDDIPVLRVSASANISPSELYDIIDQKIKPVLSSVSGVGNVNLVGGTKREIKVNLDNDKLQAYSISPAQVNQAIAISNSSYPAGSVENKQDRMSLRLDAKITKVDELRNLILRENADGSKVLLKDVANVTDAETEITTINRINSVEGIGIEVSKQTDANTVNVTRDVQKKLDEVKKQYAGINFNYVVAVDQATYTLASADAVVHDLFLAVLIVAFVMLFFLHSLRSASFILVSLPSAMIPTFILMYLFGFSLNLMTLMALSLVVGILVDDSIVVLENIYRHMEMGKDKRTASLEGRKEIGFTALAITLVDVVVFVPLAMAGGLIGNILREFSLVVVFSTLMSLFVSFTLTPLLASRFGKLEVLNKSSLWGRLNLGFEKIIDNLKDQYAKILTWALGHKRYIFISAFVLFIGSFALVGAGFIGASFVGNSDRGEFVVQMELASQTPLYETNKAARRAEDILMTHPEIEKVFTKVGTSSSTSGLGNSSSSANMAEIAVKMVDNHKRKITTDDMGQKVRDELMQIPGVKVTVTPTSITGNAQMPIQIAIKGTDLDSIWTAARLIKNIVAKTPGTDYIEFSTKTPKSEIEIRLDREKMSDMGLSVGEVGAAVQLAFRGNDQSKFKENGEEYAINLLLEKFDRQDIESVKNLVVRNNKGANIRLADFAEVRETLGQSVLERTDRLNSIKITSAAVGRPAGTIVAEIQKSLANVHLPAGVQVDYEGDAKNQKDSFGSLGLALALAIVLIYLIMVALYESAVYPFVVLFSLPLALIGALLALALTMNSMTIFAIIGFIMLMGLVAKNAILLVDFTNQLKEEGYAVKDALIEAGKERLRPILMTTVAMIFGMLPIALATGASAEVKNGMAWVIIGGLTSSLLLTLVVVPSVYVVVEGAKNKVNKWFGIKKHLPTPATHIEIDEIEVAS
ncbi:efflux RND transporter permease subunit [Chitinophagaceae bacterium LB-8]|uniref:Efflux RND transporter permease subunit n=1 Tax=Paraflavisolibacter caeni TaxID=2982496 RepID=A0A9X3BJJ2_9BACT|nr:efflux RND transporter permease subunit [Paraflavisolibacter caeni]MCU7551258.1 efflux RND transporter permease subunit [Paraflavisolibacter caeni]